jgi:hypothetical protein
MYYKVDEHYKLYIKKNKNHREIETLRWFFIKKMPTRAADSSCY